MDVQQNEPAPIYMYFYGSLAISVGLWCLGHKLIRTIGKKMTKVNPCNGFTIEFGMAMTVLLLSKAGIPVSTTQCIVRVFWGEMVKILGRKCSRSWISQIG